MSNLKGILDKLSRNYNSKVKMEVLTDQYQLSTEVSTKDEPIVLDAYSDYVPVVESTDIDLKRIPLRIFQEMKRRFPSETDETIARFLLGKRCSVEEASEQLSGYTEWRKNNLPITKMSCLTEFKVGKLYAYGFDKDGHPLIIFTPRLNFPKERDVNEMVTFLFSFALSSCLNNLTNLFVSQALMFLWWMQYAISILPSNKSKFTVLINRIGSARKNIDPDLSKVLSKVFQDNVSNI
jgi:hypothetical protein